MDNKSELFDLAHEKRELDTFLSTIAEIEPSTPQEHPKEKLKASAAKPSEILFTDTPLKMESSQEILQQPSIKLDQLFKPAAIEEDKIMPKMATESASEALTDEDKTVPKILSDFIVKPVSDQSTMKIPSNFLADKGKKPLDFKYQEPKIAGLQSLASATVHKSAESHKPSASLDETIKLEHASKPIDMQQDQKTAKPAARQPAAYTPPLLSRSRIIWLTVAGVIILLIILVAGFFLLNPLGARQTVQEISSNIPFIGKYFQGQETSKYKAVEEVGLINVRQRLIINRLSQKGIRIIEGTAVNQASFEMSKLKIEAVLFNSGGASLTSSSAYCGNIIPDDQLENMEISKIRSALLALQVGSLSNSKVPPRGQIPFMVIFTDEPSGVFKLTVMPVAFAKN